MNLKITRLYLLVICCMWAASSFGQTHGQIISAASSQYIFTVSSANATVGATYTNNGQTFTVAGTITGGTSLTCSGTGAPAASGTLTRSSGTGNATIAFSSFSAVNAMDPNLNGFITVTTSGFTSSYGPTDFEFKMFGVPLLTGDATDDNIGNPCGITDLIPDSKGFTVYAVKDASNNLIFRFRVGANNASVEAWTMLLDTDGLFGPGVDPNATAENPGFELDITLIKNSNKGIYVYDIDGTDSCPTELLLYNYNTHFQISRGDTDSCNDPDYFYDFFVPFADVVAAYNAHKIGNPNPTISGRSDIAISTGLRYAAVTNTSATCAMGGNIADVGGVDNNVDPYKLNGSGGQTQAFLDLVNNQCATPVTDLCETCEGFEKDKVHAPTIDPVNLADPIVSGTIDLRDKPIVWVKLEVYHNTGTVAAPTWNSTPDFTIGAPSANRIWSLTLPTTALFAGRPNGLLAYDKIVATVQADEFSIPCGSDGGGNTSTSSVIVTCTLSGTITGQTNVSCFGNSDGVAIVTATGGVSPYTYSWNSNPVQTTATATGLAAGTYIVTIRDATAGTACKATATAIITQQAALNATVSFTNVTINGANDGTITVNASSGGYGNYEYSINNGVSWQSSNSFIGLGIGSYNVVMRDKDHINCSKNLGSVFLSQPDVLSASVVKTNVACFGASTGSIVITNTTGGGIILQYSINGTDWFDSGSFTGLVSGVYNVQIRDKANTANVVDLDGTNNTTIIQPAAAVTVTSVVTDADCSGASSGAINITASGGTTPYTYSWTGTGVSASAEDQTGLSAGSYSVTVTDANSCNTSPIITVIPIAQPAAINVSSVVVTTAITCNGGTATVTITASGGTAPLSYTFNGDTNSTGIFTGVSAGSGYAWSVTDTNNCSPVGGTLDVLQPDIITVPGTVTDVTCNGATNGAIDITVSGGTGSYTYAWTGTGVVASNEDQSGLAAGSYSVIVTDGNSCSTVAVPFTVIEPAAISGSGGVTSSYNGSELSCATSSDGEITVTATGGTGTLTYSIDGGAYQASNVFSGLASGTHTISVKDANACTASLSSVTITAPTAISGSGAVTSSYNGSQLSCATATDGVITVTASNGSGTLSYSIDGGAYQASNVFSGLAAGTHTISVKDANACTASLSSVTITAPTAISGSGAVTSSYNGSQLSCATATDGAITITAANGSGTLSYSIDGGAYQASNVFSGLAAGTHTISVKDANACTASLSSVTITAPTAISGSGAVTSSYNGSQLSCATATDGAITVTAANGSGTLSYSIDGGAYQASNVFSGLAAGTHTISVKDANACTASLSSVTITAPTAISGSGAVTSSYNGSQLSCATATDGAITVTAANGSGTLSYSIDGGAYQASNVFSGLAAGTHTISVKDANACTASLSSVTITAPTAISGSGAVTSSYNGSQLSCATATDGAITVTAANGSGTLSYSIDGGAYQASNVFSGLAAGTHTISVKDANACTASLSSVTITAPTAISGSGAVTSSYNGSQLSCATATDAVITVTAANGSGTLSYSIDGGAYQASNVFSGLAAGTHTISVKDANACTASLSSVTITAPTAISGSGAVTSSYNGSQLSCATATDGAITITAANGSGTLSYSIDGGAYQASNVFSGLAAGTHTISVKDANACTASLSSVTITAPTAISGSGAVTSSYNGSQLSCATATDGAITITAANGSGTLSYSIDGGAYQASNVFSGLAAGTHTISVKDANACTASLSSVTITAPTAISGSGAVTSSYNGSQLSCATATDGAITVTAANGSGTLSYSIDGGAYQASNVFSGLAAGTHTISVKDANACTASLSSVTITAPTAISGSGAVTSSYNGSQLSCATATDGAITITAANGSGTLSYSIDGGAYQASNVFSGLAAGTHTISVKDANACTALLSSVTITAPTAISGSGAVTSSYNGSQLSCATATDGAITITAANGSGTLSYSIDGGAYQASNVFSGLAAGTHTISVKDANACTASLSSVTITAPTAISGSGAVTSSYNGSQLSCATATDGAITVTAANGSGTLSYSIDGGAYQASNVFSGLAAGTHTISVKDANACTASLSSVTITAPTAISGSGAVTSSYNGSQLSCATATDGAITVTAANGSGTLSYSIDGGAYQASNVFSGLAAGTHTISVKDANACTASLSSVTITAPTAISGSGAVTSSYNGSQLSCATATDAVITVTAANGSGTLSYSIDGGAYQASNVFSGLAAGTHTISVKDANACTASLSSVTITAPTAISGSGAVTSSYNGSQLSCATATDGAITITAANGSGTLSYSIDGGAYQASNVFSGLAAGTHTISVKDANACTASLSSVTITAPTAISGSGAVTSSYNGSQLSCATATDGAITITAANGSGTLSYSIDGGAYQASNVFSGLAAGTHTISVKDANACTASLSSVTITAPTAISGSGAVTSSYNGSQLSCATATDGAITVTAANGSGTLSYSIDGGAYQASNVFSGLAAGTHTISVKDANACTASLSSVTITAPTAISGSGAVTSSYNGSQLSCATATDGAITITAANGSGTLSYSIDGGAYQASNVFSGLAAGTHTISVKDANACTASLSSVTITAPTAISGSGAVTSSYNGSQLSCATATDGAITITAANGSGTLSYSIDGGAYQASNVFSGLAAGTHTISVKDANACTASLSSVTITAPTAISGSGAVTSSYNGSQLSCATATDGAITVTASNGTGTLSYSIDGGTYGSVNVFTGLGAGTHTISVQDVNACATSLSSVTITAPTAISGSGAVTSSYNGSQLSCATATDGVITVTASNGTGTLSYSIDGGAYGSVNVFTGLGAGTHTISVQDVNACATSLSSVTITAPAAISGSGAVTSSYNGSQLSCATATDGVITVTASNGTGTLSYSIDGGAYGSVNVFSGLGAGTHTISVQDVNACTTSLSSVTITAPAVISGSGAVTSSYNGSQLSCATATDAVITVTAANGSGTLSYSIDGGAYQASNVFSGLAAGTHAISVKDANACTASLSSVTITAPTAISGSGSVTSSYNGSQLSCATATDAEITVTAANGSGALSYSIDGGAYQASNVFSGLAAGTHTISVKDANACTTSLSSVTITAPTAISGSGAVTSNYNGSQLSCSTATDGVITVTASNGTGTLSYSIDGGAYGSANVFSGLGAGTHTISVQDANACATSLSSVTITAPAGSSITGSGAVTSSYNGSQLSCASSSDGQITVTATGGAGTLSYSIDGGAYQANNIFSGLGAGTHTLSVQDVNACSFTPASVDITTPVSAISGSGAVTSNYNGSQLSCATSTDGQITVTASGGTGTLTYSIDGGAYSSTNVFSGLGAGTHTLSVQDVNTCTFAPASVDIIPPAVSSITGSGAVTSSYNGSQLSCASSSDGQITVTATGGAGTLTYSIDGGAYQPSNVFSGLGAGTHTLSVQDANTCTFAPASVDITTPTLAISGSGAVTSNYNGSQLSCASSSDGQITVTATGGTGTLTYSIDGSAYGSTNVFSGLAAGTHTISVQDVNSCTFAPASVDITTPVSAISGSGAVTSNYNGSQLSCASSSDGKITVTASGGTGTLTYSIDGGAYGSSNVFSGLGAGTHTLSVQDVNTCTFAPASVDITTPVSGISGSGAVTSNYSGLELSCVNSSDGKITVTATGGTGTLTYSIDGGSYGSSNVFSGLGAGSHTLSVQDANACTFAPTPTTITPPAPLTATFGFTNVSANGANDGVITISSPTGGTGSYEYSIDGGVNWFTSGTFGSLAPGSYNVLMRDALNPGCIVDIDGSGTTTTIIEPLFANFTPTDVTCNGANDGTIIVSSPSGGYGNYEYSKDGGSNWQLLGSFTSLSNGTYDIQIRDKDDPTDVLDLDGAGNTILTQPAVLSALSTPTNVTCFTPDGKIDITAATGGSLAFEYSINGGSNWLASGSFSGLDTLTTYQVQMRDAQHTSCMIDLDGTAGTKISGPKAIVVTGQLTKETCLGSDGSIDITVTGGTAITGGTANYTFDWSTGAVSEDIASLAEGSYSVTITDAHSCTAVQSFDIELDCVLKVYQAVSPNGDGKNDYWRIDRIEQYPGNTVRLFDRFNNLVYETHGYSNETNFWSGQSNHGLAGSGTLPEDTYFYWVDLGSGLGHLSGYLVLKNH